MTKTDTIDSAPPELCLPAPATSPQLTRKKSYEGSLSSLGSLGFDNAGIATRTSDVALPIIPVPLLEKPPRQFKGFTQDSVEAVSNRVEGIALRDIKPKSNRIVLDSLAHDTSAMTRPPRPSNKKVLETRPLLLKPLEQSTPIVIPPPNNLRSGILDMTFEPVSTSLPAIPNKHSQLPRLPSSW